MSPKTIERVNGWLADAIILALALCIPFGLFMAVYTSDYRWLFFCATLFIFLS